jgi:transposase
MHIATIPNRNSRPTELLRRTWREGGKVMKETLANITDWPRDVVEGLRILLKGGKALPPGANPFAIVRSLPHGHVAAILGAIRDIGLDGLLGPDGNRPRDLMLSMIVNRIIAPGSKLATARMIDGPTACTSVGRVLGLGGVAAPELYAALDWLEARQVEVEKSLARKHLKGGALVLYDVSSSYLEGRCCELASLGYNRDKKKGKLQIVYGLMCAADGCPVAVEVFKGNTGDPTTLAAQIEKLKNRFQLERVVLVGDRGMITDARIREDLKPAGLDWITALRAPAIKELAEGPLQMSLFDERDLAEISAPELYPDERLVACYNRELARERARKRNELLAATEKELARIKAQVDRKRDPLRGQDKIGQAVGAVIHKYKMAKHFDRVITDNSFTYSRKDAEIAAETSLDGIYVVRTSLPKEAAKEGEVVGAYKSLSRVERAFRTLKTVDLEIRPVYHWLSERVRAHVFLCMLTYYVEWHMRQKLAPMLFEDEDKEEASASRENPVVKAPRSKKAQTKDAGKRTQDGQPVHSFQTLIADLGTLCLNQVTTAVNPNHVFYLPTETTELQRKAFELLGASLADANPAAPRRGRRPRTQ